MKRILLFAFFSLMCITSIFAQDDSNTTQNSDDNFVYKANQKGDQYAKLSLSVDLPIRPTQLNIGGSGSLGYGYAITDNIFVGGDVSFAYSTTIGSNVMYFIPFMARFTYQFVAGKFEFPLSLGFGGAIQSYIDRTYFGMILHPEIGAYYRFSSDWSFGLSAGAFIIPQIYKKSSNNYVGVISNISLGVKYHF